MINTLITSLGYGILITFLILILLEISRNQYPNNKLIKKYILIDFFLAITFLILIITILFFNQL